MKNSDPHHETKSRAATSVAAALACLLATAACSEPTTLPAPSDPDVSENVRRVAAILDYVAADYPGAVEDGKIKTKFEFDEQLAFLVDARGIAKQLPTSGDPTMDVLAELATLKTLVSKLAPSDEVSRKARHTRKQLLSTYGVVLGPSSTPSLDRGQQLYAQNCVACHGQAGAGDGVRALELTPRPRSFLSALVMNDLTPARAFNALSDGLPGTAMPSFGGLSSSDRWSLAFFVFTLRHSQTVASLGKAIYEQGTQPIAATPTRLAGASDAEILLAFAGTGLGATEQTQALAFLRSVAPFEQTGARLDEARRRLAAGLAAYNSDDIAGARREFGASYLDGFEPHEAALKSQAPEVLTHVEATFVDLRHALDDKVGKSHVEQLVLRINALFDSAEEALSASGGTVAFVSAFVIILREGLEGALLIMLLLGWARRSLQKEDGEVPESSRSQLHAVHLGWLAAIALGVVTWIAAGTIIEGVGGARREIIEGVVALFAAVALLMASHFVLARMDAKRRVMALKAKLARATSGMRRRYVLASLAFVAVYREAFEVVLFLQALMLNHAASAAIVIAGAASAAALLIAIVLVMGRVGNRLKPGRLLTAAGGLLCLLAFALTGKGVRALQEAAVIGIGPTSAPRIEWLGMYPTQETIIAQTLVLAVFATIAAVAMHDARKNAPAQ